MLALPLSGAALLFSGLAVFLYQLLWFRLLGFSETLDNATILMAFFSGLALGSLFAQWCLHKGNNELKSFIISQLISAISAIILLPILVSPEQIVALSPDQQIASWTGFITIFTIALIPAVSMGMAFPLLSTWLAGIQSNNKITNTNIPFLYASLNFGALIATLLGGFYILPNIGLTGGIYTAAGFNVLAALVAYFIFLNPNQLKPSIKIPPPPITTTSTTTNRTTNSVWHRTKWLILLAIVSFIWMGSEIIWIKFISLYAGATLFSFSAIVATCLMGLTIGAYLIHHWQHKIRLTHKHLFWLLVTLFITLNITRLLFSYTPQIYSPSYHLGELLNHLDSLWFALTLLLSNATFGAIISLLLSLYCQDSNTIKQRIGLAYAIHLLAAISGAVITVLWLIPAFKSHNTLFIFTLTPVLLALFLMPYMVSIKKLLIGYAILIGAGIGAFFLPPPSLQAMFKEHYYRYINTKAPVIDLRIFEQTEGVVGLTLYEPESLHLQVNGLTQSSVHIRHPHKGDINESLTALLPVLLQENATEALVLGFRAGIITRVLANSDLEGVVTTIEPEPKVVESMLVLNLLVNFTFLDDGRAEIEYKGFRDALRNDNEHYSIITAQAPYIWQPGATRQYSQEFFQLVQSRLKPDGIFSYHLNLLRVDTTTLQAIFKTFYRVFPKGVVFGDVEMGGIVLLGSNKQLVMDFDRTTTYFNEQETAMETIRYGDLRQPNELARYFLFSRNTVQKMVKNAKLITDTSLVIEARIKTLSKDIPRGEEDPYQLFNQYVQRQPDRL